MLATLSSSSVGALYERFLPLAHGRTRSVIRVGQLAVAVFSVGAAALILLIGPTAKLLTGGTEVFAFLAFCVVTTSFALQDHIVTGLQVARWSAYKNVFHSVGKLVILVGFAAFSTSAWAIIGSWWIPAVVGFAVLAVVVRRRIIRTVDLQRAAELPGVRELGSYFAGSVGILAVGTAVPLVVPLLVVAHFGVSENAYFAVAWSMVSAAVIVLHMLIGPFVAEAASAEPTQQLALLKRFSLLLGAAACLGAVGLAAVGPFILGVVGDDYRSNGAVLLYYAAAVLPLTSIYIIYQAFARATRRLRHAVAIQILNAAIILGGISLSTSGKSLAEVGRWFLAGELVSAVLSLAALAVSVTRTRTRNRKSGN
ncbi:MULTISPECIES: lipopolysaccharide biosynthesis protein [Actinomycetes]|uniref:lipopolysaccharide biosynthesis protein n=1 Tax=Actinomycetes TaxID=1760 RepID=UPI0012DCC32B|nr:MULTISPECIES: lipopolysaccharide biosynthesis protein [Actinomycetes]